MNNISTSTITSKGQILIPVEMRSKDGFKSGQKVAVLECADHLEVRPLATVLSRIDFEAERKKIRNSVQRFVDKHNLRNKKIRNLTRKEKEKLAYEFFSKNSSGV